MPAAAAREFIAKFIEVREVCLAQQDGVEQMFHPVAFETLELGPAAELEIEFVAIPNLED